MHMQLRRWWRRRRSLLWRRHISWRRLQRRTLLTDRSKGRINLQWCLSLAIVIGSKLEHGPAGLHLHLELKCSPDLPVALVLGKLLEGGVDLADYLAFHPHIVVFPSRRIFSVAFEQNNGEAVAGKCASDLAAPVDSDDLLVAYVLALRQY